MRNPEAPLLALRARMKTAMEALTSCDHFVSKKATPTIVNSMGMKRRRKWYASLSAGHSLVRRRRHERGERTRVSQAATVRVQTKKYLCAERCGGRSREGGSVGPSDIAGPVARVGGGRGGGRRQGRERDEGRLVKYEGTAHHTANRDCR